jgi:hypothetical protein
MLKISDMTMKIFEQAVRPQAIEGIILGLRTQDAGMCAQFSDQELSHFVGRAIDHLSSSGQSLRGAVITYATLILAAQGQDPRSMPGFDEVVDALEAPHLPMQERLETAFCLLMDLEHGLPQYLRDINFVATPELAL